MSGANTTLHGTLTIESVSAQNSEATALMINGSGLVGTRELGSNAFNSTTIPTNNNQLTNGAGYLTSVPNHSAALLTSGTVPAARIAHNTFDIGDTTAETGRSVHETGIYTFNRNNGTLGTGTDSAYYSVLAFGQGAGGSVQIASKWTSPWDKLYFRSLRDTIDDWSDWREVYHTSHKPTYSELGTMAYSNLTGTPTIPTNNNQLTNGASYITASNSAITNKLPLAGGTMSGTISGRDFKPQAGYHFQRSDHHSGHLEGSYNNVGNNSAKTNPIYSIGSSYNPNDATLGNFYGIGFTKTSASFITGDLDAGGSNTWGMYVAADGDARIFLSGGDGTISSTGEHYADGNRVFHDAYHPNADKWTTARTLTLSGDVSGSTSWDGSGNATITTVVADDSHNHHRLDSTDDRDMKPSTSGIVSGVQAIKPFFSSYGGMTGTANTTYVDVLALDTYSDSSGGGPSAITFKKGNASGNPEMHIWHASWNATTWGTGQRVFADNYHPNADALTTGRTIALSGAVTGSTTFDGSGNVTISTTATSDPTLTLAGDASGSATFTNLGNATLTVAIANDSHTHAFNNLTAKTSGTSTYSTSGYFQAGRGSGGVALTHNDGYGNANVTFNHVDGIPEQGNNCGRIVVNTDGTTAAKMTFELKTNTGTTAVNTPSAMELTETGAYFPQYLYHLADTDTYIRYTDNRIRIVAGGTTKFDSNSTYLTGITSSDVTTALGFTPYNATNPSGYITGNQTITLSGDVSGSGTTSISVTVADDSHNHVISNVDGLQTALDAKMPTAGGTFSGAVTVNANMDFSSSDTAARYIHMPRGGGITFYGDTSQHHGIFSRNQSNAGGNDDLLITSYGAVYIDLDSNNNNTSGADFRIGRHNTSSGTDSHLFGISGENGNMSHNGKTILASSGTTLTIGDVDENDDVTQFNFKSEASTALALTGTDATFGGNLMVPHYIYHSGDLNSYIRFPAADDFMIQVGGREFVRLDEGADPDIAKFMTDEFRMYSDGVFHADGDIIGFSSSTTSDRRLKKNIKPLENSLEKIQKLEGVSFEWKDNGKGKSLGFIAQDYEKVVPELVTEVEGFNDEGKIKTINYGNTVALLVEAMKEQQNIINRLEDRIKDLENKNGE